jgi:hypothetical protein
MIRKTLLQLLMILFVFAGAQMAAQSGGLPLSGVNQRAAAVTGDRASVQALVDEMFKSQGWEKNLGPAAASIKKRTVEAELAFEAGKHTAISEGNITLAVNRMAHRLQLPRYTRTTPEEVRRVRHGLYPFAPQLTGMGINSPSSPPVIPAKMGPAEAVFVTGMLLQTKLYSRQFQLVPEQQFGSLAQQATQEGSAPALLPQSPRTQEILDAAGSAASSMTAKQLLRLPDDLLDELGIVKRGGAQ